MRRVGWEGFPRHRGLAIQTCITARCMPGSLSLKSVAGKTFPAFPAHAQPAILRIWQKGPWRCTRVNNIYNIELIGRSWSTDCFYPLSCLPQVRESGTQNDFITWQLHLGVSFHLCSHTLRNKAILIITLLGYRHQLISILCTPVDSKLYILRLSHRWFAKINSIYSIHCRGMLQYKTLFRKDISPSLQWRHNGRDNVSNHQPHDCLLSRLFRHRSKKTSKFRASLAFVRSPVNSPHKGQ